MLTSTGTPEKEAIAATIIMMALDHDHILEIGDKRSPKDIFEHLTKMYEDKTTFQMGTIYSEIGSFKINTIEDFSRGLLKLQEMFSRLRGAGAKVDDQYKISAIGLSLPDEYRNFLDQWELSCKGKTTDDFLSELKTYHRNRLNKQSSGNPSSEAFVAQPNFRFRNRINRQSQMQPNVINQGNWRGQVRTQNSWQPRNNNQLIQGNSNINQWQPRNNNQVSQNNSNPLRIAYNECRYCHQLGHWKNECPNKA